MITNNSSAGLGNKGNSLTHIPTSAPWRFIQHGGEYTLWGANKQRVLTIRDGVIPMIPDRQLIEASPELLEALRSITESYDKLLEAYGKPHGWGTIESDNARAAIQKATGGTQ